MVANATPTGLDDTLLALTDPTRREILWRLSMGESRVTELAGFFSISLNSVSKHIRMLERAGLVRRRKKGREHFISLNMAPLAEASDWMAANRALLYARLDASELALRDDQNLIRVHGDSSTGKPTRSTEISE